MIFYNDFKVNFFSVYAVAEVSFNLTAKTRRGDFVQDASVFLISFFRIPIFEPALRRRINRMIGSFYDYSRDFADDIAVEERVAWDDEAAVVRAVRVERLGAITLRDQSRRGAGDRAGIAG